jgi:outer membrane lipoprotein SlyB
MHIKYGFSLVISSTICLILSGCASKQIVIDKQGVDMTRYEKDLAECQQYAEEIDTGTQVAKNAAGSAAVGAAVGAILGDRHSAQKLAGVGAVTGAAHGGARASEEQVRVVKNCLRGRGYKVLN